MKFVTIIEKMISRLESGGRIVIWKRVTRRSESPLLTTILLYSWEKEKSNLERITSRIESNMILNIRKVCIWPNIIRTTHILLTYVYCRISLTWIDLIFAIQVEV